MDDDGVVAALRQQQALGAVAAVSPAMGRHAARGDIVRHPQFAAAAFDDAAADRRRDADEAAIHDRLLRHVLIDGGPVSGGIPEIVEFAAVDDQLLAAAVMQRRRIVVAVVASDESDVADHRTRAGGVVVQRARAVAAEIRRDQPEAVDHRGDSARDLDHLLAAVVVVGGERIVVVRVVEIQRDVHLAADDRAQRRGGIRLGERLEQGKIVHPDIVVVAVTGKNRLVGVDVASRDRLAFARAGEAAIERQILGKQHLGAVGIHVHAGGDPNFVAGGGRGYGGADGRVGIGPGAAVASSHGLRMNLQHAGRRMRHANEHGARQQGTLHFLHLVLSGRLSPMKACPRCLAVPFACRQTGSAPAAARPHANGCANI